MPFHPHHKNCVCLCVMSITLRCVCMSLDIYSCKSLVGKKKNTKVSHTREPLCPLARLLLWMYHLLATLHQLRLEPLSSVALSRTHQDKEQLSRTCGITQWVDHENLTCDNNQYCIWVATSARHIVHRARNIFHFIRQNCLRRNDDSSDHSGVSHYNTVSRSDICKLLHIRLLPLLPVDRPVKAYRGEKSTNMLCSFQLWQRCFQFDVPLMHYSSPAERARSIYSRHLIHSALTQI